MNTLITPLTTLAIVLTGLMSGLFFIFSFSVMDALAQMPALQGMRVMQLINRTILNPAFLTVFIGSVLISLTLIGVSATQRPPGYQWIVAGALVYLIGGFGVTLAIHVPLNYALDLATPGVGNSVELWSQFLVRWTPWNTVRTVMSVLGTVFLAIGLRG